MSGCELMFMDEPTADPGAAPRMRDATTPAGWIARRLVNGSAAATPGSIDQFLQLLPQTADSWNRPLFPDRPNRIRTVDQSSIPEREIHRLSTA